MRPETSCQFSMPEPLAITDLIARLRTFLTLRDAARQTVRRIYYDSFDWRLYGSGFVLAVESMGAKKCLALSPLQDPDPCSAMEVTAVPRFARDFPQGDLRRQMEKMLHSRALLPRVRVQGVRYGLEVLNRREKTVLHLVLEAMSVVDPGKETLKPLERGLRVVSVRGFRKRFAEVSALLQGILTLRPAEAHVLPQALKVLGHDPLASARRLNLCLDPAMRADQATKLILHRLFETMKINEAGVRNDLDSEFLHDFRVAVRRTRSALGQIKQVFPRRTVDRFAPRFAWLGAITTPPRDLDVYLLQFDELKASLPECVQKDLEPLYVFLEKRAEKAHRQLASQLDSSAYRKLMRNWQAFLEMPVPQRSRLADAMRPIRDIAGRRIFKLYRKALLQGRAITPETPAQHLHELRKTCKKLRYLMEFFESLYSPSRTGELLRGLKDLQDNLGAFQDTQVQMESLQQFGREMLQDGSVPSETLLAMGVLVDHLYERQQSVRSRFAEYFKGFAAKEMQASYQSLLGRAGAAPAC